MPTPAEIYQAAVKAASPSTWRAIPTDYKGRRYPSKAEADEAATLDWLVKAGEIKSWSPQPLVKLGLGITYRLDFLVRHHDGTKEYIEVKGRATRDWRLKWKMAKAKFRGRQNVRLTLKQV